MIVLTENQSERKWTTKKSFWDTTVCLFSTLLKLLGRTWRYFFSWYFRKLDFCHCSRNVMYVKQRNVSFYWGETFWQVSRKRTTIDWILNKIYIPLNFFIQQTEVVWCKYITAIIQEGSTQPHTHWYRNFSPSKYNNTTFLML